MGQVIMSGIVPRLTVPVPPPPAATNLTVTGSGLTAALSWTNPEEFYQVIVTQKEGSAPTSPTDGEQIYIGTGASTTASGLSADTTYYWAVFPMNESTSYSKDFPTGSYTTPAEVNYFNAGDLCEAVTGGWSKSISKDSDGYAEATATIGNTLNLYTDTNGIANGYATVTIKTKNKIDVTNISKLHFVVTRCYYNVVLCKSRFGLANSSTPNVAGGYVDPAGNSSPFDYSGTLSIDVSSLTGSYYISVYLTNTGGSRIPEYGEITVTRIYGTP